MLDIIDPDCLGDDTDNGGDSDGGGGGPSCFINTLMN
jgi:hypothetical protein